MIQILFGVRNVFLFSVLFYAPSGRWRTGPAPVTILIQEAGSMQSAHAAHADSSIFLLFDLDGGKGDGFHF